MNNNWFCEDIRATNPCGEQPLPPYGACFLGSINLTKFVKEPFTDKLILIGMNYKAVVNIFTRMLDNVVEINGLPLRKQRDEIARKRRHGMGYLGLGSSLAMMQMTYGDEKSLEFTEKVTKILAEEGWKTGIELAKEKGLLLLWKNLLRLLQKCLLSAQRCLKMESKLVIKLKGKVY